MATLTDILLNAQKTTNAALRSQAIAQIEEAEKGNVENFLGSLMQELSDETKPIETRALAGTLLKNFMVSHDPVVRREKAAKWLGVPEEVRTLIKNMTMSTFASPKKLARLPAAAVAAAIAAIEVPAGQWNGFVGNICRAARQKENLCAREAALVSLAHLGEDPEAHEFMLVACEDVAGTLVAAAEDENATVRVEGLKALSVNLDILGALLTVPHQMSYTMKVVCSAASLAGASAASSPGTREAAMSCLVRMVELYYPEMGRYMQAVFSLTYEAIQRDDDAVAMQALEFWTTTCDVEQYLIDEALANGEDESETASPRGLPSLAAVPCQYFIKGAAELLVPVLWGGLLKQDESAEPDDWNVCYASARCLQSIAMTMGDQVVPITLPIIAAQLNRDNDSWRHVEAAVHALGCLLDATSTDGPIQETLHSAVPILLHNLSHPRPTLRSAAGWCLGRLCEFHADVVVHRYLKDVMRIVPTALTDEDPQVASKACYVLFGTARAVAQCGDDQQTNDISKHFAPLVEALYNVATGTWSPALRKHAWEALAAVVGSAAKDCAPHLVQLLPTFLAYLESSLAKTAPNAVQEAHIWDVQSIFCSVVHALCRNVAVTRPLGDRVMTTMLKLMETRNSAVRRNAIMAIGALALSLGVDFKRYVDAFLPHLLDGVQNHREAGMCSASLLTLLQCMDGVTGAGLQHYEGIMVALLQNLKSQELDPHIKPKIIAAFGDVALQAGDRFSPFVLSVMKAVGYAMRVVQAEVDKHPRSEELRDYLNDLREHVCVCYTGIVLGLKTTLQDPQRYLHQILQELQRIAADRAGTTPAAYRNALQVVHDVVHVYKANMKEELLKSTDIEEFIRDGAAHPNPEVREAAELVVTKMARIDFLAAA